MESTLMRPAGKLKATTNVTQRILLFCGALSIFWYVAINSIVPLQYPEYSIMTQTVSELSAIDTPTRSLWTVLCIPFSLLTIAFGCGIWLSANHSWKLRFVGIVVILDAIFGMFWPPMHKREVIAAGGGTLTDNLHIAWAFIHLGFMLLMMGFGAAALGKKFGIYTITTIFVFIVFGFLTAQESPGIEAGTPTPYIGVWERINMGAYMLWVVVFAIALLRYNNINSPTTKK